MKKFLINLALILCAFFSYFLQSDFFSWFNIGGILPNLFVILIVFIGLFGNKFMGTIYGILLGFFLDYLFRSKIGITALGLGVVGFCAKIFDKNFSKDSRITIMMIVSILTILFEVISYFLGVFIYSANIEIFSFIKILIIETIFNAILTSILYPLMQKFGYYIENEYNGNRILTRYF